MTCLAGARLAIGRPPVNLPTLINFHPFLRQLATATTAMPFTEERPLQQVRRRSLQSVMMRSGTSRGLFLHRDHLPAKKSEWSPILLAAMGSATGDKRQLDGVGGATSTTSKIAIVGPSERENADIDYTFAQVAVGSKDVDMTGTCGNMASGVGPFALDEGLVRAEPGQKEVRPTGNFILTHKLTLLAQHQNIQHEHRAHPYLYRSCRT